MSGMHRYNPEQIMLSAAVRKSSREVSLMKEKLIFTGTENGQAGRGVSHCASSCSPPGGAAPAICTPC